MAIRFDIKVFEQVKTAYMYYLETGRVENQQDLGKFDTYKPYLDADKEIQNLRKEIKSQKDAERRRIEEQRKAELKRAEEARLTKKAALIAWQTKQIAEKAERERKRAEKVRAEIAQRAHARRMRMRISPFASRLNDVSTFEDLKSLMNSSFVETVKSTDQLMLLRSAVIRCTKNHETEKEVFLKILEKRQSQLQDRANMVIKPKELCENPRAVFISTPMGGQNKRY